MPKKFPPTKVYKEFAGYEVILPNEIEYEPYYPPRQTYASTGV